MHVFYNYLVKNIMIFQAPIPETLQLYLSWIFVLLPVIVVGFFILKYVLKKVFPGLAIFFYFIIPTYLISIILVFAISVKKLNIYALMKFPLFIYLICPPLVWDTLFGMAIAENNVLLVTTATFFIVCLPLWVATRSSAGTKLKEGEKRFTLRRLFAAWIIVTIMGFGMPNFYSFIFTFLLEHRFLGINLLLWIAIFIAVIIIIYIAVGKIRKKDTQMMPKKKLVECELIDGELICPEDRNEIRWKNM